MTLDPPLAIKIISYNEEDGTITLEAPEEYAEYLQENLERILRQTLDSHEVLNDQEPNRTTNTKKAHEGMRRKK